MKDRSSWTDEQINEEIAKKKGTYRPKTFLHFLGGWSDIPYIPDYTHDWQLGGELLEEIPFPFLHQRTVKLDWVCSRYDSYTAVTAPTPLRAICEEWLEWEEEK